MNETEYHAAWQAINKSQDARGLALEAGALTTEPAFIFIAGYQAAIRASFPEVTQNLWLAYAASEDRNPVNPKPGVTINNNRLSGFKTWLAMSREVDQLIIKSGTGADARYLLVERENTGLNISHKENVKFLTLMSQGIAEFKAAEFTTLTELAFVKQFAKNEPLYIYLALLGSLKHNHPALNSTSLLIEESGKLSLSELDHKIQNVLEELALKSISLGTNWETDKQLFSMYSKGIQARA
ncbi:MAG: hypothetical protein ACI9FB_001628 [Candidatus Azotimanducaceae bacterium]|jgi:hypothetical protein